MPTKTGSTSALWKLKWGNNPYFWTATPYTMGAFIQEATNRGPFVNFEPETGKFLLEGRSIPENALEAFAPLLAWTRTYIQNPAPNTHLEFKLSYFNSSSTEHLLELLNLLKTVTKAGHTFTCCWYREADDEDMEQIAQDFMALTGIKFQIVVVQPIQDVDEDDDI
jgi:hypothetical protein